jgi:predicted transcriptional regulator
MTSIKEINKEVNNAKFINHILSDLPGFIEIREFNRKGQVKKVWFKDTDELLEYKPPKNKDIYFGVSGRKDTTSGKASNLTKVNALWADYDDVNLKEVKKSIKKAGLPEASIHLSSGHGIHSYWLLDEPFDANKVISFVKYISNETGSDSRAAEAARIMRLPGSYNNKSEKLECKVIELDPSKKYSIKYLSNLMGIRPAKSPDFGSDRIKGIKLPEAERPCINSILKGVETGERNWAQGRLTKWLQMIGYSKQRAYDIVLAWNELNQPPEKTGKVKNDFYAYWEEEYKLLGCTIPDAELQEMLSHHCDRYNCPIKGSIDNLVLDNHIKLNNRIFNKYRDISGYELIVYGVLLAAENGLNSTQIKKEITHKEERCMERHRIGRSIDKLADLNLIEVKKRRGRPTFCKVKKQGTFGKGYTLINNGVINGAIYQAISPTQLKVYILLLKYSFNKGTAFPSTLTLSEKLGVKRQTISDHIKALEESRYLKRRYDYNEQGAETLTCILLV